MAGQELTRNPILKPAWPSTHGDVTPPAGSFLSPTDKSRRECFDGGDARLEVAGRSEEEDDGLEGGRNEEEGDEAPSHAHAPPSESHFPVLSHAKLF